MKKRATRRVTKSSYSRKLAGKKGRAFQFNLFVKTFHIYYILHNYAIPQLIPHAIPQTSCRLLPSPFSLLVSLSVGLLACQPVSLSVNFRTFLVWDKFELAQRSAASLNTNLTHHGLSIK